MRIRKRPVPLPFSSLCPTTPPDPQSHKLPSSSEDRRELDNKAGLDAAEVKAKGSQSQTEEPNLGFPSSVTEEERTHLDDDQLLSYTWSNPSSALPPPKLDENHRPQPRPSSDLQLTIIRVNDGWICSDGVVCGGVEQQKKTRHESCCICPSTRTQANYDLQTEEHTKAKGWRVLINNNSRNASSLGGRTAGEIGVNGVLSSSSNQVERWCEEEKAFPLKKRRGSFNHKAIDKEKKMRSILKITTNQKWVQPHEDGGDDDEGEGRNRGVEMEGSRCSRINGRGWRCCQKTLMGYSLCEHHLGKGRIRSSSSIDELNKPRWLPSSSVENDEEDNLLEEKEEEKPLMSEKKRKKIGMVKARSISILLSQTNNRTSVVNGNNGGII
ncbi:hypothetical protein NE237_004463 [Protea cynaroides]|uniref:WRC domain-containing protein n=1 Tax=Protea cynaroides TaxID=273540 RepID=A0A9Q0KJH4_9MAGN|nr:hypothetical protein NE237_004463 [Protea cynaroides]